MGSLFFSMLAGLAAGAGYMAVFAAVANWRVARARRLRRKCRACGHYPVHGSFPAVCSGCRDCSEWKEGEL